MASVLQLLDAAGGLATLAELTEARLSADAVQRSVGTTVTRVRRGIYASATADPDTVRAARVGGALAAGSAADHHKLWVPPKLPLTVSVRPDAHGLRHPDKAASQLGRDSGVRVLRDGHRLDRSQERWVVSLVTCLAQAVRIEPQEYAVAMLDSALRDVRTDDGQLVRRASSDSILAAVAARLPQRCKSTLSLVDSRSESGSESIARVRFGREGILARPQVEVTRGVRVDLLIGDRLVIEIGSFKHHGGRDVYEKDRARAAVVAAIGCVTLDFTYQQVLWDWSSVLAAVRAAMRCGDHIGRLQRFG